MLLKLSRRGFSLLIRTYHHTYAYPSYVHLLMKMVISGGKIGKLVKKYVEQGKSRSRSLSKRNSSGGWSLSISRGSSRSRDRECQLSGSDCEYCWGEEEDDHAAPADVPAGCMAVYVGAEMRRYVIQTSFLHKQAFRDVLRRSEEEYGFDTEGGLRIACEAADFEKLLWQQQLHY